MTNKISTQKIIIAMLFIVAFGFLIGRFAFNMNDANQAVTGNDTTSERAAATNDSVSTGEEEDTMMDETMVADEADEMINGMPTTDVAVASEAETGIYTDYNPALLANADNGEVILFFHASWCPSCRGLDRDINENFSDLPADVTILQVDYDNSTELKKQYGVVRQHTLVRVDSEGNQIETLTGLTNTLDQVLAQI